VHTSTIPTIVTGRSKPSVDTVASVVRVLGDDVQDWLGATVELGPYQPAGESQLLTEPQRETLTTPIRSIGAEQRKEVGNDERGCAPTKTAGTTPAPGSDGSLKVDDVEFRVVRHDDLEPAPSDARELTRDDVALAARELSPGGGQFQRLDRHMDAVGEASQDAGGED